MSNRPSRGALTVFITAIVVIAALCAASFIRARQSASGATAARAVQTSPTRAVAVPGPAIQVDAEVYDFGTVNAGDLVNHTFIITNAGDQTLEISDVHTSCGCTTAGDYAHEIEPGRTGALPIQFNSVNKSGPVTKTIRITSNASNQPEVTVTIAGIVRPLTDGSKPVVELDRPGSAN